CHRRLSTGLRLLRFLVQTNYVAARVTESRRNLRSVGADRLDDVAPLGCDGVNSRRDTIDHDVDEKARFSGRGASRTPRPADLPKAVVEGGVAVAPLSNLSAEDCRVEVGRSAGV